MHVKAGSRQGRTSVALGCDLVDRMGEANVEFAEPARIVGRKNDFHSVVDVEELGVVVHFFGEERHSRDEPPGLGEVAEMIALADGVAVLDRKSTRLNSSHVSIS